MEQQAQEQAAGEDQASENEPSPEEGQSMQPTESSDGENGDAAEGQAGTMTVEGLSVSEAQDLLDSLRGSERLLPFSESTEATSPSNHKGEIRDW